MASNPIGLVPVIPKFNRCSAYVVQSCEGNLLQHQFEALKQLQKWFHPESKTREDVALVSMPTGSGKTGIICCLPYFIGEIPGNQLSHFYMFDKPVLVIAPDLAIADQLARQMSNDGLDHGENFLIRRNIVPKNQARDVIPHGLCVESTSALTQDQHLSTMEIVIANAQKFLSEARGGRWETELPDDLFKLVIVDEAHHHPAQTWRRIVDKFNRHAKVVFFTATPFRADGQRVVENLEDFAYQLRRDTAIDNGIIRRTEFIEEESFLNILDREHHDLDEDQIGSFAPILNKARELQLQKNRDNPLPGGVPHMIMAITKERKEADLLLEIWRNLYPEDQAAVYHSKLKKRHLKETMTKIKNNELKLVIVCSMLLEGFDHPPISIAAVACRIGSPVRFCQFVGRAQRICRFQGEIERNGVADIVTHYCFSQAENYHKYDLENFAEI